MLLKFFVLLVCLESVFASVYRLVDFDNVVVCNGPEKVLTGRVKNQVTWMRYTYGNCTHVNNHLIIANLKENDDISFLSSIQVVGGALIIEYNHKAVISLPNLKIVHGNSDLVNSYFKGAIAVYIYSNTSPDGKRGIVDLRSLRSVVNNNIMVRNNRGFCYLNNIKWKELLEDPQEQEVKYFKSPFCNKSMPCNARCEKRSRCWGPEINQCQKFASCGPKMTCSETRRCLSKHQCCNSQCAGGCFGTRADQCVACRNLENSTTCLDQCPPEYHSVSTHVIEKNPNFRRRIGSLCTIKCPGTFFEYEGVCVRSCGKDYVVRDRKCIACNSVKLDEKEADVCKGNCHLTRLAEKRIKEAPWLAKNFSLFSHNKPAFTWRSLLKMLVNCTRLQADGGIRINERAGNINKYGDEAVRAQDLQNLRNLREIYGYVDIDLKSFPEITNISFLSNLESVTSSDLRKGINIIRGKNLLFLGLNRLRSINTNFIAITFNEKLCYMENFKNGISDISRMDVTIKTPNNKDTALCRRENKVCDRNCVLEKGCWGPGPKMCFQCKDKLAGDTCVSKCTDLNGYFTNSSNPRVCGKCHPECLKSCTGPKANQCVGGCKNMMDESFCVEKCPRTKYSTKDRICQKCNESCTSERTSLHFCTGPSDQPQQGGCNKCSVIIFEKGNVNRCKLEQPLKHFYCELAHSRHNEYISLEKYLTPRSFFCQRCHESCETCFKALHKQACKTCGKGHLLYLGRGCFATCPAGSYRKNRECEDCSEQCHECNGPSASDCKTCRNMRVYLDDEKTKWVCNSTCPSHLPHAEYNSTTKDTVCVKQQSNKKAIAIGSLIAVGLVLLIFIPLVVICCERRRRAQILKERELVISKYTRRLEEEMVPLSTTDAKPNFGKLQIISAKCLVKGNAIGSGAFGTVFRGTWRPEVESDEREVNIDVAIKELKDASAASSKDFLAEAHVMASVNNHYCVHLLGVSLTSPMQLVSVFVSLGNLTSYMPKHKNELTSRQLLTWALQIASGMEYLESMGIVHRDLAARNVLLERVDWVRITDFGLAKLVDPGGSGALTIKSGRLPVQWLAIECLTELKFSHKSDVWAFGVTLWEIFTFASKRPYAGKSLRNILDYLENGDRLDQPENCTLDLYMLLLKCWVCEEDGRPTFQELIEELRILTADPTRYLSTPMDLREDKARRYGRKPSPSASSPDTNEYIDSSAIAAASKPKDPQPSTTIQEEDMEEENDESGYLLPDVHQIAPARPPSRDLPLPSDQGIRSFPRNQPNVRQNVRDNDGYMAVTTEV